MAIYQDGKHSLLFSGLLGWFVPGGGSIYNDHWAGAVTTWILLGAGGLLIVPALGCQTGPNNEKDRIDRKTQMMAAGGLALMMGGVVYSIIDSIRSAKDYNQRLRQQLGLPEWLALSLQPMPTRTGMALATRLHVTF
jgi:hypothetical protein